MIGEGSGNGEVTYHGVATLKEPVWIWAVPVYFHAGGVAAAALTLAAVLEAAGGRQLGRLAARARWLGAAGTTAGTALLIYDLGRPERFLNMLRVFRPTSPMSVGSWILSAATGASVASAALSGRRGVLGRLGKPAVFGAGATALPLGGYTGVLLASTATPAWQGARRSLPLLFTASGMAGAASALELLPMRPAEARVVERFGRIGKLAELCASFVVESEAGRVQRAGRPYRHGVSGALWRAGQVLSGASLAASFAPVPRRLTRARHVVTGLAGTAGALSFRFAVFYAGKASARDPRATFRQQRSGLGAAEVTGFAGITGPGNERAFPER